MTNLEKGLTRRSLLGDGLRTAGGIILLGVPSLSLSSCIDTDDWGYTFDTSGLNSEEFSKLFIEAGKHYWGVGDRNDYSLNKAYFGYIPPKSDGTILRGRADWFWKLEGDPIRGYDKVYTYEVIFNDLFDWVDCGIEGEEGDDFFQSAGHEWGHIFLKRGNELHSDTDYPIMQATDRC